MARLRLLPPLLIAGLQGCSSSDPELQPPRFDAYPPPPVVPSIWERQVVTDTSWLVDGTTFAVPLLPECTPPQWQQLHPAQWIWRTDCGVERDPRMFLRRFVLPEAPDFAQLEILVDNYAYVFVNDEALPNLCSLDFGPQSYGPAAVCGYVVPVVRDIRGLLRVGENTIRVMVHNAADSRTGLWNPAGLLARITLTGGGPANRSQQRNGDRLGEPESHYVGQVTGLTVEAEPTTPHL